MIAAIQAAQAAARKVFGADIRISVARSPAFGNDDVCVIVAGAEHAAAARSFARVVPSAKISEQISCAWMDRPAYTYSVIEWEAAS